MMKHPYKTAVIKIAKIIDMYKAEDSERGKMCREIERIIQYTIFINHPTKKTE